MEEEEILVDESLSAKRDPNKYIEELREVVSKYNENRVIKTLKKLENGNLS